MKFLPQAWRRPVTVTIWLGLLAAPLRAEDELAAGFSEKPAIEKRLADVLAEINAIPAASPPELRQQLQALEAACQIHISGVDVLEKARSERDKASAAARSWNGFPQPPPYSIIFIDDIRETLATLAASRKAAEVQIRLITAGLETARNSLDEHQKNERRLKDALDSSQSNETHQREQLDLALEQISSRISAENVARIKLRLDALDAEQEMIRTQIDLTEQQRKTAEKQPAFPRQDLDDILERIARQRAEAVRALVVSNQSHGTTNPLLASSVEFLDLEKDFWQARFAAFGKKDSATRKSTLAAFAGWKAKIDDWMEIIKIRLDVGGFDAATNVDPAKLRIILQDIARMQRRIGFATADVAGGQHGMPVLDLITSRLLAIWETELYLAEDDVFVDGKKITTYRAITVAKVVRLAIILAVGWLLLRLLARRMQAITARRPNISPTAADVVRKTIVIVGFMLLMIYGFDTVKIPFTALAFLGGALAIGVGFGTQTLLKNFISGIILLFERPLKVGDVVEVEGITGRIQRIGVRASVIQHFDGIETVVPNSTLLENQVTNWTFSNTMLRHSITVGVAYGSHPRDVARALLAVGTGHGLVLEKPAPEVRFEDFGDNALIFRLLFWFDAGTTARDQLASDLRFMIEKSFSEASIVMAYPQRDIHFDPDHPLRVELTNQPSCPT